MVSDRMIEAVADRIAEAAPGATVVLFGSHARGSAGDSSDLDILVIEPTLESRHAETTRLADVLDDLDVPVDLVVVSAAVYREWSSEPGTVIHEAAREGRVLRGTP